MSIFVSKKLFFIFLLNILSICTQNLHGLVNHKLKLLFFMRDSTDVIARAFITNQIEGFVRKGHDVWITFFNATKTNKNINNFLEKNHVKNKFFHYRELISKPREQTKFDVIICHSGSDYAHHVAHLRNQCKLSGKLVCFLRGWDLTWTIREKTADYIRLFKEADLFLSVCEYLKKYAVKLGCPADKIFIQRSGINCHQFKYRKHDFRSDGDIILLTVASDGLRKGLSYMVYAAAKVIMRYPKVKFVIVGPHNIKNIIDKLPNSIKKNIINLGKLPHTRIPGVLDRAHIFIAACVTDVDGKQEGIPTALKEAMACGLPVISTYHAGIPELIEEGKSGFLVKERDIKTLAQKIEYLINNPELCIKMGQKARQVIETEHNLEKENNKFETIIMSLVK